MSVSDGNYLAFDYGDKKIGVAVGQPVSGTATALDALKASSGQPDWQKVTKLIAEWQPLKLIIGLPLNMDGSEQPVTQRAKKFANRLHGRTGLPIELKDERLTSVSAKERLFDHEGFRGLKPGLIDSVAACDILESWFDSMND